jgi:aspartate/tyrosine/aromatic aminotransferase
MNRIYLLKNQIQLKENSLFEHIVKAPDDPILGTTLLYKADKDQRKMNLGVGAYRTNEEKPYVFEVVKEVEKDLLDDLLLNKIFKEYPPIDGETQFRELSKQLIFGKDNQKLKDIATVQSLSGTGSLRLGFEFINRFLPNIVLLPNPTWQNHQSIIRDSNLKYEQYPYYNPTNKGFDYEGMIKYLDNAKPRSIVLLHAAAHNPTGVDPSKEEWIRIFEVVKKRNLIPFFDSAYQGFASGDLERDAFPIRYFLENGLQLFVAQSYSKNMGMYGERVGAFHVACNNEKIAENVISQLKLLGRAMYSMPPIHGSLIVTRILNDETRYNKWKEELEMVSLRIQKMRLALRNELERIGTPGKWEHITNQIGMFSYTGLSVKQCEELIKNYHIYLIKNGRISMCGLTTNNVNYLAASIKEVIEKHPN